VEGSQALANENAHLPHGEEERQSNWVLMLIERVLVRVSSPKAVPVAEMSWISLVMDLNQCSILTQVPIGDAVFMPPSKMVIPCSTQKLVLPDFLTKNPDGWELI
jgi:hypothetical protein